VHHWCEAWRQAANLELEEVSMSRLSPRRVVALLVSMAIVAIPVIVAALTAAPGCPNCGFQ
jgi:hypothetical protein